MVDESEIFFINVPLAPDGFDFFIVSTNDFIFSTMLLASKLDLAIPACTIPFFSDTSGDLRPYTNAEWGTLLKNEILYCAVSLANFKIRYLTDTTATYARGSGMADTKLNSEDLVTFQAGADDYRSQYFPAGSQTTINTYYLRPYLAS